MQCQCVGANSSCTAHRVSGVSLWSSGVAGRISSRTSAYAHTPEPAPGPMAAGSTSEGGFMHSSRPSLATVVLGLALPVALAWPAAAHAQVHGPATDVPPASDAPPGQESVQRGVQGPEGMLHARVLLHMNTSSDRVGEPISLAPDLYYAFSDTFQAGIVHNLPMGWLTRPGAGLCLTGDGDGGCRKVYDNVG